MNPELHPNLPPLPARIAGLPVDERGYPVPWFVAWINGKPDFRVIGPGKIRDAVNFKRCWVCGERLGKFLAFAIGPMCAVNRISAEPPSHRECAIFSAMACPFLTKPAVQRRDNDKPEGIVGNPNHIPRNPGCALVWVTTGFRIVKNTDGSPLFEVGEPTETLWYAYGKPATRAQVFESIESGMPFLLEACKQEPESRQQEAFDQLRQQYSTALGLIPPE